MQIKRQVKIVILDEGLNKVRDLINTNLTLGQCGTGISTATPEDTGLDEAVGATSTTLTNNVSDKLLTASFTLPTTNGNGLSFTEFENQFLTGETLARIRHTALSKDNTKELQYIVTYSLEGD